MILTMNGRLRPMISWNLHGTILVVICSFGILAQKCDNKRRVSKADMGQHLLYNGFTKDHIVWIYHGEVHRMREEVVDHAWRRVMMMRGCRHVRRCPP
jgi:hypothetical protein